MWRREAGAFKALRLRGGVDGVEAVVIVWRLRDLSLLGSRDGCVDCTCGAGEAPQAPEGMAKR